MKPHAKYSKALQQEYLQIFRDALLPPVAGGNAKLILAHPARGALPLPKGASVTSEVAPLLREPQQRGSYVRSAAWPQAGFHASRFAMLLCVLEGAIDLRLGVTRRMARQYSQLNRRHGFQIWRLPEKSICLIPPNVPFDDGDRPHWCGPDPSKARSRLHWIHLIPAGALLHSCHTVGTAHEISPFLCVHDPRLVLLGELLCEELGSASPRAREIAHANLLALLWRIEQGIAAAHFMEMEFQSGLEVEPDAAEIDAPDSIESAAVRRAHRFIQAHLHETLTVEAVAVAAYGSASWLNRQFQKELGLPIMQYVTQCRIREARLLLADTDLPVTEIGKLVGFPDPSYFSQVFTRWEKISPARFRHRHRSESN